MESLIKKKKEELEKQLDYGYAQIGKAARNLEEIKNSVLKIEGAIEVLNVLLKEVPVKEAPAPEAPEIEPNDKPEIYENVNTKS